jgi:hypothetical protein
MLKKIIPYLKNKYVITTVAFIVWITFFDRNDLITQYKLRSQLNKLEEEKSFFIDEIKKDSLQLQELKTNSVKLEQFGREKYLMKKDEEEIFVVVTKNKEEK